MPTPRPTLTILDPTSLLGREVVEGVAGSLPEIRRRLLHTGGAAEHLIADVAGEATLVPPLVELDEMDDSSAVVVTAAPPPEVAGRLVEWLRARPSVALLDCTQPGIAGAEATSVLDAVPLRVHRLPWYHLVDPSLAAPARWLRALLPLEPSAFVATLLCPVSAFGAEAFDELASQGSARLSGQPTGRLHHLPAVLAFDVAPARDDRVSAMEGQLGELFPDVQRGLHVVDVGVFHGTFATLQVRCSADVPLDEARALLRATPQLRLARRGETPTSSSVVGGERMICGGLRAQGPRVAAWLFADGLRVGGAHAALEVLGSLSVR